MSLKGTNSHINKVKVRYSEIDCQSIVYNSHYLTYFDISISELLDDVFDQNVYIKKTNNEFHTVAVQMDFKFMELLEFKLYISSKRFMKYYFALYELTEKNTEHYSDASAISLKTRKRQMQIHRMEIMSTPT